MVAPVKLGQQYQVELPVCKAVYSIPYEHTEPMQALTALFEKSLKKEF